ncbi:hypothetical protein [Aquibacillus sediminis]|uniref:hypothetical protein n=1 Tax=Aquibacillus sediminis TaxID=2574734 RepID=UPI0014872F75|nr:hypothetical protein [Aquibacillus sediminis]
MAPKANNLRLVATTKQDQDIHVTILDQEVGFIYFYLSDIKLQRKDVQAYITDLHPKILSGVYDAQLVDMAKEEICC